MEIYVNHRDLKLREKYLGDVRIGEEFIHWTLKAQFIKINIDKLDLIKNENIFYLKEPIKRKNTVAEGRTHVQATYLRICGI